MKIIYISNSGSPGGVEQHILDLIRGLKDRGHEITVVCPAGSMADAYAASGAHHLADEPGWDLDPAYILRLRRLFSRERPDIVHAHQLKTVVNGLIAAKLAGVPGVIAHIHTPLSEWPIAAWKKRLDIFVNRLVTNWAADAVVALTPSVRQAKTNGEGIRSEKLVVIPNGVDLEKFAKVDAPAARAWWRARLGLAQEALLIGTLGRQTVEKGHRFLVGALPILDDELPAGGLDYRVLLAGDGELRPALVDQATELGLAKRVVFLGFLPEEHKLDYLAGLDVFVFPSLAEGFGIALIEAMAMGLPCLASDLPVLREVGDDAAEFFGSGDPRSLGQALAELLGNPARRAVLGIAARRRVAEEFSLASFWNRYEELYTRLIHRPKPEFR